MTDPDDVDRPDDPAEPTDPEDAAATDDLTGGGESTAADDPDAALDPLTHTDESGDVQMVNVGDKPDSARRAVARGSIHLTPETVEAIRDDEVSKGDVLATARIGAIQAVKHTWEAIPMCHQIPVTNVDTDFTVGHERVDLEVAVETTGKTGCEMEALEGVTTGLNTVWDMVKAAEKDATGGYPDTRITDVEVVTKEKTTLQ